MFLLNVSRHKQTDHYKYQVYSGFLIKKRILAKLDRMLKYTSWFLPGFSPIQDQIIQRPYHLVGAEWSTRPILTIIFNFHVISKIPFWETINLARNYAKKLNKLLFLRPFFILFLVANTKPSKSGSSSPRRSVISQSVWSGDSISILYIFLNICTVDKYFWVHLYICSKLVVQNLFCV